MSDLPPGFDSWLQDDTPQRLGRRWGRYDEGPDPEPSDEGESDPDTDDRHL